MRKLHSEAQREHSFIEGRAATEDHGAIVAAMTRGESDTPPPDYNNMFDAEFRDTVKKRYGITVPI